MEGIFLMGMGLFLQPASRSYIDFAADNGFQPMFLSLFIKIHHTEEVAVIGHGNSRQFEGLGLFKQPFKANLSIQQAILGVEMKMYKRCVGHKNRSKFKVQSSKKC